LSGIYGEAFSDPEIASVLNMGQLLLSRIMENLCNGLVRSARFLLTVFDFMHEIIPGSVKCPAGPGQSVMPVPGLSEPA